ncbi:MAG: TetR/AcrR family transcriptional regulator [Actinomycetota bacterium]
MGSDSKNDLILEASTRVFPRVGYHAATVADVLREANVARATFYARFSGKRELFTAVIQGMIDEVLSEITLSVDSIIERFGDTELGTPNDELVERLLVELMTTIFAFIERNRGMARVFLHELVGIDDEMTGLFYDFQDKLTDQFARLVAYGREIRYLRDTDSRLTADFIVGGLIHLARAFSAGVGDYDIDEVCRQFVELQLKGLMRADTREEGVTA